MIVLLTPIAALRDVLPEWVVALLFLAVSFFVIVPIHFAVGPLGRRFGRELNEAAVLEDRAYRRSLGPTPMTRESDAEEGPD